jgi:hypothetical protein
VQDPCPSGLDLGWTNEETMSDDAGGYDTVHLLHRLALMCQRDIVATIYAVNTIRAPMSVSALLRSRTCSF